MPSAYSSTVEVDFDRLKYDFDRCLAEVLGVAKTAATTTGPAWRAIVEAMTGQPPPTLPAAGTGANASIVRSVLIAIQALYERRLESIERAIKQGDVDDEVVDTVWTFRHRRLAYLVTEEVDAYIKVAVPRPSVASVFAKAAAGAGVAAAAPVIVPDVDLTRCTTCAAPRLGTTEGHCLYCGDPFVS